MKKKKSKKKTLLRKQRRDYTAAIKELRVPVDGRPKQMITNTVLLREWIERAQAYGRFVQQASIIRERLKRIFGPVTHHDHLTGKSAPMP